MVLIVRPWFSPVFPRFLCYPPGSPWSSQVDHVVPDGSCFEAAGPQGFVKYLAKYVDILGIDDREGIFYCYEGNLLVRRINLSDGFFTDVEDTLFQ